MGTVEDYYQDNEDRRQQAIVDEYSRKVGEIIQMVPAVVVHLTANPTAVHRVGWYLCSGELRVAWRIFDRDENNEGILLFSDGRLAQSCNIMTSRDRPGQEPEWFDPQDPQAVSRRLFIHCAYEGLKAHMPPPPQAATTPRKRWWRG